MVQIPYIKIPSVRMGSIVPASNIGTGGATPAQPTPITYLTQWRMMGNSEVHGQEIWSCGEYNPIDGKYHILVQPLGGSIADIALDEPLRKVNDVADSIEFSNSTTVVTRNIGSRIMGDYKCSRVLISSKQKYRYTSSVVYNSIKTPANNNTRANILCPIYDTRIASSVYWASQNGISVDANTAGSMYIYDENYAGENDFEAFEAHIKDVEVIYELATPTTEVIQAPQIQEAESYSCVIGQGGKAVSWSSFTAYSE